VGEAVAVTISVIIPVLNEARALPATLSRLASEIGSRDDVESIVVDGGSTDGSLDALGSLPFVRVLYAPRGRAPQLNAGARAATGDVLLFLHADTLLPAGALDAIAQAARAPGFVYGGFRHLFSDADWRLRLISRLHNYRCSKAATFYGDQALFVSRDAFFAVGGFPHVVVEDIALCQRLRAVGSMSFLPLVVVTSSRKFVRMGVWRSFARVIAILLCLRMGVRPPRAFFADVR
jgi:rSAM/selenodomain-associated transferase 2